MGENDGGKEASLDCRQLRVAFAGTPEFAAVALDALIASEHEVVGVLTQPDRPGKRGKTPIPSAVKKRALAAGIEVQQPLDFRSTESLEQLSSLSADVLVVAAYGVILPQTVLDLPPLGCLNIHASLLPRWRGAAPIQRAILAGDSQTGICIMQMDVGLDTGDVLLERTLPIGQNESAAELDARLAALGALCLLETLQGCCDGSLTPTVQSNEGMTYAQKLSKQEAQLDFNESALQIHRKVRAFNSAPIAYAFLRNERVRILTSRMLPTRIDSAGTDTGGASCIHDSQAQLVPGTIVDVNNQALVVSTGDGLIELLELQWPGKKRQSAAQFAHGRDLYGECFNNVNSVT